MHSSDEYIPTVCMDNAACIQGDRHIFIVRRLWGNDGQGHGVTAKVPGTTMDEAWQRIQNDMTLLNSDTNLVQKVDTIWFSININYDNNELRRRQWAKHGVSLGVFTVKDYFQQAIDFDEQIIEQDGHANLIDYFTSHGVVLGEAFELGVLVNILGTFSGVYITCRADACLNYIESIHLCVNRYALFDVIPCPGSQQPGLLLAPSCKPASKFMLFSNYKEPMN